MQLVRSRAALAPRRFGRGPRHALDAPQVAIPNGGDLKLFATTFLAGFIFVSILIG